MEYKFWSKTEELLFSSFSPRRVLLEPLEFLFHVYLPCL